MVNVRVGSRRLVKASDESIQPHVLPVSILDLLPQTIQVSIFSIFPNPNPPAAGSFHDVVVAGCMARHWLGSSGGWVQAEGTRGAVPTEGPRGRTVRSGRWWRRIAAAREEDGADRGGCSLAGRWR
uniref:Uncharacterized protein n=1 Tax=Leersia perrieri TaxID=77586 RepID=A0A0D9UZB2_9ORYZ